jgi:hypothetical protein
MHYFVRVQSLIFSNMFCIMFSHVVVIGYNFFDVVSAIFAPVSVVLGSSLTVWSAFRFVRAAADEVRLVMEPLHCISVDVCLLFV